MNAGDTETDAQDIFMSHANVWELEKIKMHKQMKRPPYNADI